MTEAAATPIIGVGTSAGGIEALEAFFRGLPPNPGFAIVVITPRSPERDSQLLEVVGRATRMSVQAAVDGTEAAANAVYLMPPGGVVGIEAGRLIVTQEGGRRERKPIDLFLSALAIDRGEWCGGVILAGGGNDGTLGIKAIKERGGVTLAQAENGDGPASADMPDSAIATGYVDFAVPAEKMGEKLVEFARGLTTLESMAGSATQQDDASGLERSRDEICAILRHQVGHDFSGYKDRPFLRRVQRRMQITQLETIGAYVARLRQDPAEAVALFRDLLINVTKFFRDADAFEALVRQVIPQLFEQRGDDEVVRIWVPGCATGEEVYSIAIIIREHLDTLGHAARVQIFATDIDEHALTVARSARYPGALLEGVSAERRARFFVPDGGGYLLSKEIRELCIFSPHSVIRDPPFSRLDLVSCRNLLIYLGADAQAQVIPTFHYSLRPGGFLFLGTSENIRPFRDMFTTVDQTHRLFRKREDIRSAIRLPMVIRGLQASAKLGDRRDPGAAPGSPVLRQTVQARVLERFAPPHVVVNRDGDVVYFSSRTGKYIEAASGSPTRQLLTMVRKGLRLDVRTMFRRVLETNRTVSRGGIALEDDDGRVQFVTITIDPLLESDGEPLFMLLFSDEGPTLSREDAATRAQFLRDGQGIPLEQELRDTRERLQSLVEEYETALDELKASNEDLQSVNEEFQSTNEELKASKEELQSVNEELQTVNSELNVKVDSLDRANTDLQNLFDSTNVAIVFLDSSLRIRSYTPAVHRVFNILPGDRGRPVTDLSGLVRLPELTEDVGAIMAGRELVERQVELEGGTAFLVRITPYRSTERVTIGAAVTFVDVTVLRRAEGRLRVMVAELQHRTRNVLGVVQAIARQTIERGAALDGFLDRLIALSRVQGLISGASEGTINLDEIVRLEVSAHGGGMGPKVTIAGPPVALRLDDVQTTALVLHELATNAVKYGALKAAAGRLDIAWTLETVADRQHLVLDWRESGVPMLPDSGVHRGFGRQLIEHAMAATMLASTSLSFGPDGIWCHIEVPLQFRGDADVADSHKAGPRG